MALAIIPASLFVLGAGTLIAFRIPLSGWLERLTATVLLTQAVMTALLLVCGVVLARLDPLLVLALAGATFAITFVAVGGFDASVRQRARHRSIEAVRAVRHVVSEHRLAILGLGVLALAVILAFAWRSILSVRLPVLDYDGLSYHLVTVDVWLQGDAIGRVPQRIWSDGYPANGELLTLWLMLFAHTDTLGELTSLLPLPLAAVATAGLARQLGASRVPAVLAGLLVASVPAAVAHANSTYVDNLAMADVAAAWFLGLRAIDATDPRRRRALYVVAGAAIGLAVGVKGTLLLPLGVLTIAALVTLVLPSRRAPMRSVLLDAMALVVPLALLGGYWYLKNLVVFGNPLWPFTFGPFVGLGSFEQLIGQTPPELRGLNRWAQIATSWFADVRLNSYAADTRVGGFGLAWPPVLLLGALGVVSLVRRRRYLPILILMLPVAATLAVMPMPWWPRYSLFAFVLGAATAAAGFRLLPRPARQAALAVLIALSLLSLGIVHRRANFTIAPVKPSRPSAAAMVRLVFANEARRSHLGLWADCEEFRVMPPGSRIRTDGFNLLHLVVGPRLDRELLLPVRPGSDPAAAIGQDGVQATYLALVNATNIRSARAAPDLLEDLGPVCRGVELFAVRSP